MGMRFNSFYFTTFWEARDNKEVGKVCLSFGPQHPLPTLTWDTPTSTWRTNLWKSSQVLPSSGVRVQVGDVVG